MLVAMLVARLLLGHLRWLLDCSVAVVVSVLVDRVIMSVARLVDRSQLWK